MSAHPVAEWIKKAEDNYQSALALVRRRAYPVPDVVCNQCQQCIEKYQKALLARHQITFMKTHDLVQLKDLIATVDPDIHLIHAQLLSLNPYGIDIRYPGVDATPTDARNAITAMKVARKLLRAKLSLKP
jgi:HEPN domain-containing protein